VTGPGGTSTSQTISVTVVPAPPPYAFAPQWTDPFTGLSIASPGSSTQLNVPLSDSGGGSIQGPPLTYQWYHNGQPIPGATDSSYQINSVRPSDAGDYFVALTSSGGTATSLSTDLVVLASANAPSLPWVDVEQQGSILYFACASPAQVCRYNMATGAWLAPVALPNAPTALCPAPEGVYIAMGQASALYSLDLASSQPLPSSSNAVFAIFVDGPYAYLAGGNYYGATFVAINRSTLAVAATTTGGAYASYSPNYAVSPSLGRVYTKNPQLEPSSLGTATLNGDGTLAAFSNAPSDPTPESDRIFSLNGGSVVAGSGGAIYSAATLELTGSFGAELDDLCQTTDGKVWVLRGGTVTAYDSGSWAPIASASLSLAALRLFSYNGQIVACSPSASGGNPATIESFSETSAAAYPAAGPAPVSPPGLAFLPFAWAADTNGNAYFLSKLQGAVYAYSASANAWQSGLPVGESPNGMAYDPTLDRIYLYYADNRITKIDLDGSGQEAFFSCSPLGILSITAAGGQLVAHCADAQDDGRAFVSFSSSGTLESAVAANDYNAPVSYWNSAQQTLYGAFQSEVGSLALSPQGIFTAGAHSGGGGTASPSVFRFSPDGSQMVDNTGAIWSTTTLQQAATLGISSFTDAAWSGSALFTLQTSGAATTVQSWSGASFTLGATLPLAGYALGMAPLPNGQTLAITENAYGPIFTVVGSSGQMVSTTALENQPLSVGEPTESANPSAGTVTLSLPLNSLGLSYQWQINGVDLPGATQSSVTLTAAQVAAGGSVTAVVTNLAGNATSVPVTVTAQGCRLVNLSSLAQIGTGGQALAAGFYTAGGGSKQILFRGIGPTLAEFSVPGVISDPELTIFNGSSARVAVNNAWGGSATLSQAFAQVGAFALPAGSLDDAALLTLVSGGYTAQVQSASGESGEGMIEIYDADPTMTPTRLVNISTRAVTGASAVPLTAGFSISGPAGQMETVLIRGVGPSLAGFNVANFLTQPVLNVYDSGGTVIATNSGWGNSSQLSAAFQQTGAFALQPNSADAAVLLTLAPGTYTAQVTSADRSSGVALVEVYEANPSP
jgi:hypothetical protein